MKSTSKNKITHAELVEAFSGLSRDFKMLSERIDALEKGLTVTTPTVAANPLAGLKWGVDSYSVLFEGEMAKQLPGVRQEIISELNRLYDEFYLKEGYTVTLVERNNDTYIAEDTDDEAELSTIVNEFFKPVMSSAFDSSRGVVLYYLLKK